MIVIGRKSRKLFSDDGIESASDAVATHIVLNLVIDPGYPGVDAQQHNYTLVA